MCHTETTREGRLLHDWFTSKHRLISVVSSSPSQVVSPESAVSEELPRVINNSCQWRHAHMQAGLVEHHDEKDSQQNPNDSQRPASVHQQAQRIPTVNITEATGTSTVSITPNAPATASMLAMRAAQSETMPPSTTSSPAVFYSYWSFCSPIIPFPVMRPFLWSVAAGNPIRSSWKQPNIRHLNPRQTTLGNSMELHHDPFLSFALSGYNHEWYGTVHAHHASLSFPICMENIFG